MTQRDLADKLAIPQSIIAKIEIGERQVDVPEYFQIVSALKKNPEDSFLELMKQFTAVSLPE